jgi:hypothetical protein
MGYKIKYFGWNNEAGHDKVWGYVLFDGVKLYNFWGPRGKKLAFQEHEYDASRPFSGMARQLETRAAAKTRKGYRQIDSKDIETEIPGFKLEFEKQLTIAKMFERFRYQEGDNGDDFWNS